MRRDIPSACSLSKCQQWPTLGKAVGRSLELHPGLPSYMDHLLLPTRVCQQEAGSDMQQLGLGAETLIWDVGIKTERYENLPSTQSLKNVFLSQCIQQLELGQPKARSQELNMVLPYGWQGLSYLSLHLLPAMVCVTRKLNTGIGLALEPRHSGLM